MTTTLPSVLLLLQVEPQKKTGKRKMLMEKVKTPLNKKKEIPMFRFGSFSYYSFGLPEKNTLVSLWQKTASLGRPSSFRLLSFSFS
jgi:hypothetical protein